MSKFVVKEIDWPAQSPNLNPGEHLRDILEETLRSRPSCLTLVSDLINALLEEWPKIPRNISKPCGRNSQKSVSCFSGKDWANIMLDPMN